MTMLGVDQNPDYYHDESPFGVSTGVGDYNYERGSAKADAKYSKQGKESSSSSSSSLVSRMLQCGWQWNTTTNMKRDVKYHHSYSQRHDGLYSHPIKMMMMRVKRRSSDHLHHHDNNDPRMEAEFAKISRIFENYENQEFDESWRVAGYAHSSSCSSS